MTEDLTRGFTEESAEVSSDLQDGLMTGAEGAETLTGQADGMLIDRPEPGETLEVSAAPGQTYVLNFDPSEAQTSVEGDNLVLIFGDGSRIVFGGLVELAQAGEAPAVQYAGEDLIAALVGQGVIPGVYQDFAVERPDASEILEVSAEAGVRYVINFDPSLAQVLVQGDDLILVFPDGGRIVFKNLGDLTDEQNAPLFDIAGSDVTSSTLISQAVLLGESGPESGTTLETAAADDDAPDSGGIGLDLSGPGDAVDGLDPNGVIPGVADDFTLINLEPSDPAGTSDPSGPVVVNPPVATDDMDMLVEGGEGNATMGNVLTGEDSDQAPNDGLLFPDSAGDTGPLSIVSVEHDGFVYTDANDGSENGFITFSTALGGYFMIDVASGEYTYYAPYGGQDHSEGPVEETFVYTIENGDGLTDSATLTVEIKDTVPTANDDSNMVVEGGEGALGNVLTNDVNSADFGKTVVSAEQDGSPITLGVAFGTSLGGTLTLNANGTYSYTPPDSVDHDADDDGVQEQVFDTVTYTMTDSDGSTSTATLSIEVKDTGVAAEDDSTAFDEADQASVSGNVLDGTDSSGTPDDFGLDGAGAPAVTDVTFTSASGSSVSFTVGSATVDGNDLVLTDAEGNWELRIDQTDGSYTFTLLNGAFPHTLGDDGKDTATLTFEYSIADSDGSTATATLTIDVTDDVPLAVDDTATTDGVTPIVVDVIANDDEGTDGATVTSVDGTSANGGTVALNLDGTVTYTPPADFSGSDTFDYVITDADGDTSTGTVTMTVAGGSFTENADAGFEDGEAGTAWTALASVPAGSSEGAVDLNLSFTPTAGTTLTAVEFDAADLPAGSFLTLDGSTALVAVDGVITVDAADLGSLQFMPAGDDDDTDVTLTYRAVVEAGGETFALADETLTVVIDAVADQPTGVTIDVVSNDGGDKEFDANETGSVTVNATFGDTSDGSETHTVVVEIPEGFTVTDTDGGTWDAATRTVTFSNVSGTSFTATLLIMAAGDLSGAGDTFTVTATAEETTLAGDGEVTTDNNLAEVTAIDTVQANVIVAVSAELITNSSSAEGQFVNLTISSLDGTALFSTDIDLFLQGQQGTVPLGADGILFEPDQTFAVTLNYIVGDNQYNLTDFNLLDANGNAVFSLQDQGNIQLSGGVGSGSTGAIWIMTPDGSGGFNIADPVLFDISNEDSDSLNEVALESDSPNTSFVLDFKDLTLTDEPDTFGPGDTNINEDLFGELEQIDIAGSGDGEDNTILLRADDILDVTEGSVEILLVTGDGPKNAGDVDGGDTVTLVDQDGAGAGTWTLTGTGSTTTAGGDSVNYDTYTYAGGGTTATINIQDDLNVDLNALV